MLRFVARGGMGAVYEVTDLVLRSRVALKTLEGPITSDEAAMERFRREVLLARRVSHPNVCRVYELYRTSGADGSPLHFLTMEFLEGETVAARLTRGRLSTTEALPLVQQMCDGLSAAHAQGVIHRDFKSGNVMLVPRSGDQPEGPPRVAITDFGVARAFERGDPETEGLTGEAAVLGTPEYMAPEQVTGGEVSPATDVYALGVVMYQMVTGQLPFAGGTPLATAARRLETPPPRPELAAPGLDPRWSSTILRCLDRDPQRRFQTAAEVAAALTGSRRRGRLLLWAALALVLLLVNASIFLLRKPASSPRVTTRSIAVLPFADMSPEHDQEYFSDGVAQEIIDALAQVPGLHVVARSSSFSFKGKNEDLRSVGQKLNVANVLEGSVRKSGGRLRVSAQLVSTADGYRLWSRSFDREVADVFGVQDEIAHAVVDALRMQVLPEDMGKAAQLRVTNPEVYATYLRGRQFRSKGGLADVLQSIGEFRKAIALEPDYAPAHAWLAESLVWYGGNADSGQLRLFDADWRRHAAEEADKAVALNPRLADAYLARGRARAFVNWDWPNARADYEHALALAPGDTVALQYYAQLLVGIGRASDAVAPSLLAVELDPLSADAHYFLGFAYSRLERYDAARTALEKAVSLAPQHPLQRLLGHVELLDGHPAKALAIFERLPARWARLFGTAVAQHTLGDEVASRRALDELIESSSQVAAFQIAEAYAWRGERETALEWLERAYETRDTGLCFIKADRFLRPLWGDPRYGAFLAKLNLPPE